MGRQDRHGKDNQHWICQYALHGDECENAQNVKQGSSALGKNPKTPNTHSLTHTLPQSRYKSSGPLILKNITCVLKCLNSIVLIQVLMYLIANCSPKTFENDLT